ncbi:YfhD family protein [Virgibacillus sp. C22-A2]|uniref:YfhD family protein n=1 Tax=Virgibacillus tibetensis TaxID=3042313 RepID=A0ABU6KJL0_9BACI|nr:YfhD family protein [Virgibacillus sp. C22-A2]
MGRDDHKNRKNNYLAQTPKNLKTDGKDIEFAEEFADHEDKEALSRSRAADRRVKER